MEGYGKWRFEAPISSGHRIGHDVYQKGSGPVVVIIQELPGIGKETLHLADLLEQRGFTVVLPHLFGPLGRTATGSNFARVLCMRREFKIFAKNNSSPIVDWLRALCRKLRDDHDVEGVATIGMCLTGNFAISLMADDAVLAGVASQPSLPVILNKDQLHMSETDIDQIRTRLDQHGPMKAFRFENDNLCPATKFDSIDQAFNDDRERVTLRTIPGDGHAVLTLDFVDKAGHPTRAAFDEIVEYFQDRLSDSTG